MSLMDYQTLVFTKPALWLYSLGEAELGVAPWGCHTWKANWDKELGNSHLGQLVHWD